MSEKEDFKKRSILKIVFLDAPKILLGCLIIFFGFYFLLQLNSYAGDQAIIEDYYDEQNVLVTSLEKRANGSYLVGIGDDYAVVEVSGDQVVELSSRISEEGSGVEK